MPGDHRTPASDVIDVTAAVYVEQISAVPTFEIDRFTADTVERPDGRINAAWYAALRLFV
jgi:hypothetical protein